MNLSEWLREQFAFVKPPVYPTKSVYWERDSLALMHAVKDSKYVGTIESGDDE